MVHEGVFEGTRSEPKAEHPVGSNIRPIGRSRGIMSLILEIQVDHGALVKKTTPIILEVQS